MYQLSYSPNSPEDLGNIKYNISERHGVDTAKPGLVRIMGAMHESANSCISEGRENEKTPDFLML